MLSEHLDMWLAIREEINEVWGISSAGYMKYLSARKNLVPSSSTLTPKKRRLITTSSS